MLIGWTRHSKDYTEPCDCPADFTIPHGKTGKEVDAFHLDHYARVCPNPPFSRLLAEVLYQQAYKTFRYTGKPSVSVTMLTGCPLQIWMERKYDYVDDPLGGRWMLRGTFAHEGLLQYARSYRYIVEQPMRLRVREASEGNIDLYGTLDVYDVQNNSIHDLKTQKWSAVKKKAGMTAAKILEDPWVKANVFQINAYRAMWSQVIPRAKDAGLFLHYWDGDLQEVKVEVPAVDVDKMGSILTKETIAFYEALSAEDPRLITPKNYEGYRWNPRDNSPLVYKIREVIGGASE